MVPQRPNESDDTAGLFPDPASTALLVVDVQNDFVHPAGRGRAAEDMTPFIEAVDQINRLIDAARETPATIVYVRIEHGPHVDTPPYQARYERNGMTPDDTICHAGTWGAELYPDLRPPRPEDHQLVKHGYDAFHATGLAELLGKIGVTTVLVTGVTADLCLRATAFSAFEHGFFVIVPKEGTASLAAADCERSLADIAQWYGEVVSVDAIVAALRSAGAPSNT